MSKTNEPANSNLSKFINISGYVLILLVIFGLGVFFGYKYQESNKKESGTAVIVTSSSSSASTVVKTVEGVYWIKVGQEPICPKDYTIKGTFDANSGNYYTKENKRYDTIKADICFASEEFARDTAGFVKKF